MIDTQTKIDFGFRLFQGMQKDNLGYIYRGLFTQSITDSIISLTETNFDAINESSKVKRRVFAIMVECLQNITRHQTDFKEENVSEDDINGIFIIQNKDNGYYITTGNVVNSSTIPKLTEQLNTINSLEKDDLKNYYMQMLERGDVSPKGGAGLGLIDMARKSGNKLSFDFKTINNNLSYFYLHTSISKDPEDQAIHVDLENIKELHELINSKDILLIFNGILNQDSLINLLSIIEGQMIGTIDLKKKVFNVMVEMLQNIVKHATKKENDDTKGNPGIFFMSEKDGAYSLNTGNYISNRIADELSEKIDHVNSLEGDELDLFYSKRLLNFEIDNSKEAGLGIIDLRLKSGNKLEYNIYKVDENLSFFTLQIRL
ncbi:MAG: hypothetical protein IPO21_02355 [Bacteroidales bacterium]|nr:hypothetical protein [Bacteroidales bacterium]